MTLAAKRFFSLCAGNLAFDIARWRGKLNGEIQIIHKVMKTSLLILSLLTLAVATAGAQQYDANKGVAKKTVPSAIVTSTANLMYKPKPVYSGVAVQVVHSSNPLQLINPFAPLSAGRAEDNVSRNPMNGRMEGVSFLRVSF